jgi:hypothetical protein
VIYLVLPPRGLDALNGAITDAAANSERAHFRLCTVPRGLNKACFPAAFGSILIGRNWRKFIVPTTDPHHNMERKSALWSPLADVQLRPIVPYQTCGANEAGSAFCKIRVSPLCGSLT